MRDPADSPLAVQLWPVDDLIPYAGNAKLHPPEQIERLAAAIDRFGWDQPIVVDGDGVIIKGHGRRLAALSLGLERVPVLIRSDLSRTEADALRISDNAVVGLELDMGAMQEEIARLMHEDEIGLGDFGFDDEMLGEIKSGLELATPDLNDVLGKGGTHDDAPSPHKNVSLSKLLGFKSVTPDQAALVARLAERTRAATGKTGVEAFITWLESQADKGEI